MTFVMYANNESIIFISLCSLETNYKNSQNKMKNLKCCLATITKLNQNRMQFKKNIYCNELQLFARMWACNISYCLVIVSKHITAYFK